MRRRDFITGIAGSAAALPLAARAQQDNRVRRVGVLTGLTKDDPQSNARFAALRQRLEKLGWSQGRNISIDYRFAPGGSGQEQVRAKELVGLQPDVILAQSTPIAAALQRESSTIPIVFVTVSDPVGSGFVVTLARPGRNLTGLLMYEDGIIGKWLAMLKEIAPHLKRAALVANPKTTPFDYFRDAAGEVVSALAIELVPSPVNSGDEIERAIETFARVPDGGIVLPPDTMTFVNRDLVVALAARYRLPAVYAFRPFVAAGGLMSYGIDIVDVFREAASYIDRILRGARPDDLPVQAPTKYETVLNLKTAKALGLTVPITLLVRADEVIE